MPAVTFIVPVFNKLRFLPAVLRAIDGQTGDFDHELIIVDDGSTDGSSGYLAEFASGRADVAVIRLEDRGPSVAINAAAARAGGQYLKLVDGDDVLAPNATELLLDAARANSAVVAFGGGSEYRSDALPAVEIPPAASARLKPIEQALPRLLRDIPLLSACLVEAAAFRRVGGCDERVFVHDMPLLYRLALAGRFVEIDGAVVGIPARDADRWSNRNLGQVLHDVNLALYWLLREHPEIAGRVRREAFHRAAGRAWKWARRHGGHGVLSRYFALNLISYLPVPGTAPLIRATLGAFTAGGTVRAGE